MRETHEMILNGRAKSGEEEWVCSSGLRAARSAEVAPGF